MSVDSSGPGQRAVSFGCRNHSTRGRERPVRGYTRMATSVACCGLVYRQQLPVPGGGQDLLRRKQVEIACRSLHKEEHEKRRSVSGRSGCR